MANKKLKILISGAGTATCQGVIKGILKAGKKANIEIHTMDGNPLSAGRFLGHRFHTIPQAKDGDFIPELMKIAKREGINLIIPIVDYEFEKLSANKRRFLDECGTTIVISDPDVVRICTNKMLTYKFFKENNIPTADTVFLKDIGNGKNRLPKVLKPVDGRASINVFIARDKDSMEYYCAQCDPETTLVQDFAPGQECTIDFICDFNGRLLGFIPRMRLEIKSGISYKGKTFRSEKVREYLQKILKSIKFIGAGNVQCFKDGEDYKFIEINPRFSGAYPLSLEAGMNGPLMIVDSYLKKPVSYEMDKFTENLYMLRYWEEVFVNERDI